MAIQNQLHRSKKRMTLRAKINWLVFLNIIFILTLVISVISYFFITSAFEEAGVQALTVAKTVANMADVKKAFKLENPSTIIQPIATTIQKDTNAEFIVVANMKQIRYSHPDPQLIGKTMDPDPGDDEKVLSGHSSITQAMGSLGLSVRGKTPIFDSLHHQIGFVSVGYLVSDIWDKIFAFLIRISALGIVALTLGLWGAHLLSGHIKRQIFNMEPFEIAFLAQNQASILESIREGIIAVDIDGKITTCNQEAKRLLGHDSSSVIGKHIESIIPNSRMTEVLEDGIPHRDQPMIIGNSLVVVNRVPVTLNGSVIGAVTSFRDKMELDQIDQRLADVGRYADALRSQRHEFMNKLHTISGLIKMEEYDLVRQLIDQVNDEQQQLLEFFMSRIRDAAVVGILIGKLHRAKELGISLLVDEKSYVSEFCPHRDIVVTILGNAIENAMEAMANSDSTMRKPTITVYLKEEKESLFVSVADTGPGISPKLKERIFEDGVSTKGPGRGFGLALISRLVSNVGGHLSILSSNQGATLEVKLHV